MNDIVLLHRRITAFTHHFRVQLYKRFRRKEIIKIRNMIESVNLHELALEREVREDVGVSYTFNLCDNIYITVTPLCKAITIFKKNRKYEL